MASLIASLLILFSSVLFLLIAPFLLAWFLVVILLKFVFNKTAVNIWTIGGILFVGSLLASFFSSISIFLGLGIYLVLVAFAFYKKFSLTVIQTFITLILIMFVFLTTDFLLTKVLSPFSSSDKNIKEAGQVGGWNLYSSSEDGFRVLFLGSPQIYEKKDMTDVVGKKFIFRRYTVSVFSYPSVEVSVREYNPQEVDGNKPGFDAYAALEQDIASDSPISFNHIDRNITFKSLPAVHYTDQGDFSKKEGYEVLSANKFYRIVYSNSIEKWSQEEADKFFNSFELIK